MFLNTFTLVPIFTLLISSIFNFIKIILNLYLINIIENCECKQKTRTCKYKQKY